MPRHYIAADVIREWLTEEQRRVRPRRFLVLDRLATLLDELETGGKTDG